VISNNHTKKSSKCIICHTPCILRGEGVLIMIMRTKEFRADEISFSHLMGEILIDEVKVES